MARLWAGETPAIAGSACFPARGLPQSGSKGLSQSKRQGLRLHASTPPANAPRPSSRSANRSLWQSRRHAEQLVQLRARRRVLQRLRALRVDELADREGGERRLVEAADDELLLARIGVDVADREDARRRGLEARGVDDELLLLEREAPVGDRAELRAPAEQDEERVERQLARLAVAASSTASAASRPSRSIDRFGLAGDELDAAGARAGALSRARVASSASKSSRRWTSVTLAAAAAPSSPAAIAAATAAGRAADDDDALAGLLVQRRAVLEELRAAVAIEAVDLQPARLERADAAGDDDRLGDEARAASRWRRRSGRRRGARRRSPAGRDESRRRTARSASAAARRARGRCTSGRAGMS